MNCVFFLTIITSLILSTSGHKGLFDNLTVDDNNPYKTTTETDKLLYRMLDQNLNDLRDEIYYADKEVSRFHFGFNQIKKVIHKNPSTKKRNPFQRTWKKSENTLKN